MARRLGYPVRIALAHRHLYCRWDDGRERFNIEATNPAGMVTPSTTEYREHFCGRLRPEERASGFYLRPLNAAGADSVFVDWASSGTRNWGRYSVLILVGQRGGQDYFLGAIQWEYSIDAQGNATFWAQPGLDVEVDKVKECLTKNYPTYSIVGLP